MKLALLTLAAVAALAGVDASAKDTNVHIRVHVHHEKHSRAVCYKQCPQGQWCAGSTQTCRGPTPKSSECFNYAIGEWIPKCDPGFECKLGKCEYASGGGGNNNNDQGPGTPGGAICYKQCPGGQWCARGTQTCRAPTPNSSECFDLSQGLWIPKCAPGFSCKGGKCA